MYGNTDTGGRFALCSGKARGGLICKEVGRGLSKSPRSRFAQSWKNLPKGQQAGYVRRQPVNVIKAHQGGKGHNCGSWLKPNHRENCSTRNIICNSCGVEATSHNIARKQGEPTSMILTTLPKTR